MYIQYTYIVVFSAEVSDFFPPVQDRFRSALATSSIGEGKECGAGLELLIPPSRNAAALRGASGVRMRGDRPGVGRAGARRDGTIWMETAPGIHVEANRRLCLTAATNSLNVRSEKVQNCQLERDSVLSKIRLVS